MWYWTEITRNKQISKELWTQNMYLGDSSNHMRKRAKDTLKIQIKQYAERERCLVWRWGIKRNLWRKESKGGKQKSCFFLTSHKYRGVQKIPDLYVPTSKIKHVKHVNIFYICFRTLFLKNSFRGKMSWVLWLANGLENNVCVCVCVCVCERERERQRHRNRDMLG